MDLKTRLKVLPCGKCEDMMDCDLCIFQKEAKELYQQIRADAIDDCIQWIVSKFSYIDELNVQRIRVPQLMSKMITVICVNDKPICTVRGKKSTSDIIARLSGYDAPIIDGRIQRIVDKELNK